MPDRCRIFFYIPRGQYAPLKPSFLPDFHCFLLPSSYTVSHDHAAISLLRQNKHLDISFLVLILRMGIPIRLALIYIEVAGRLGLDITNASGLENEKWIRTRIDYLRKQKSRIH